MLSTRQKAFIDLLSQMVLTEPGSDGKEKKKKDKGGGSSSSEIDEIIKTQHLMQIGDSKDKVDRKLTKLHSMNKPEKKK